MGKSFLDPDTGFLYKKRPQKKTFTVPLERTAIQPDYFTDEELYAAKGSVFTFDLEIYPNYFLAAFKCYNTGKVITFELCPWKPVFNTQKLLWVMHNFTLVGFNSLKFDLPIVWLALQGGTLEQLNEAVEQIIKFGSMPQDIERTYGFKQGSVNHIDLIEVAPLSASLKTYGGRLHAPRLQDLPYDPTEPLTQQQAEEVCLYCVNDLDLTTLLLRELEPQLELRTDLSLEFGQDLRSKKDAQIAEAVIVSEVAKANGYWPKRPRVAPGSSFKYEIPEYIEYKTPVLQNMYNIVKEADFVVRKSGKVLIPEKIDSLTLQIGKSSYNLTIGGLHSTESSVSYFADKNTIICDFDVESFYPRITLNRKYFPKALGPKYLPVYGGIVDTRLAHKAASKDKARKKKADSLKIVINSGFGLTGSKYSRFYSPDLMISVTMTGQLSLLMLIEAIELAGIPVISGNTDGIVMFCPQNRYSDLVSIIKDWENRTNFKMEETRYKSIHSQDVNDYFALKLKYDKEKGWLDEVDEVKVKGRFAERGSALNSVLSKNPTNLICSDAVIEFLKNKTPLDETIKNCKDIRRFVTLRNVKGGGEQNGVYLGKVVRWYMAKNNTACINYVNSGNQVAGSLAVKPLMDLPKTFPDDIDYDRYIADATKILYEVGFLVKPQQARFF